MVEYIGKRAPESTALREAYEEGFDAVELYLTCEHLDNFDAAVEACKSAEVEIRTVHTPHVYTKDLEYLQYANDLAEELDAFLVFHSGSIHFTSLDVVEDELEFTVPYGFENQPGYTQDFIEETLFENNRDFVLDIAHLFTGLGEEWKVVFDEWMDERIESIPVVHFCDSTRDDDGLAIGDGEMELEPALRRVDEEEELIVVLEVPVERQKDALEWVQSTVGYNSSRLD